MGLPGMLAGREAVETCPPHVSPSKCSLADGVSESVLKEEPCECAGSGDAPENTLEPPSLWWQECAVHSPGTEIKLLPKSHPREKAWGEHTPLLAAVAGLLSEGF